MEPSRTLRVRISGAPTATSRTTWGQRAIWRWHGVPDEATPAHFPTGECAPLPPGSTVDKVAAAVAEVVRRHDALRTVFARTDDGWHQHIEGTGELTLPVYEADGRPPREVAREVAGRLAGEPWSVRRWPVRVAVVVAHGEPVFLSFAANRLAIDGYSVVTVVDDLLAACAGAPPVHPDPWQASDEARFEESPDGRAVTERALAYWRDTLFAAPRSLFDHPPAEPTGPRFRRTAMESPALGRAVRMLRRRHRVGHSALLLAATIVVLGRYTGHRRIVLQLMTGNRMDRERKALVGTLASEGLLHVDPAGLTFPQLARRTFQESGRAHRFGFCDPDAVEALVHEVEQALGAHLDLGVFFNDVQTSLDEADEEPDLSATELRRLAGETALVVMAEMDRSPAHLEVRLHLTVGHGHHMPLVLFCDTAYVPPSTMDELLLGIERVLIGAASGEQELAALGEASGVTPVSRGVDHTGRHSTTNRPDGW